jgi:glycosyltransferase involved in cell wall biosynthesis
MQVLVTTEERFSKTPDGSVWTSGTCSQSFWQRYLDVFDRVRVLARVADVRTRPELSARVDGDGVTVEPLPHYIGPAGYARARFSIQRATRQVLSRAEAVILRAASPIANCARREMQKGQPYGIEIVGDPYEVFAPGSVSHPLRPLLRWWMTGQLRRQCRQASAVAYVCGRALRERYRPHGSAFTTSYSSVELHDDAFVTAPRNFAEQNYPVNIASVGTLEVPYKGFDVLIDAVALCVKAEVNVDLSIIGDGRCRASLEEHARRRGVAEQVRFMGRVAAGASVRAELDRADLFVLASKTEGLPRAMIEAMARALPCIGTAVGGIPELLGRGELVPRGDSRALANKIRELLADAGRMTRLSAKNLAMSRHYHDAILVARRREFLTHVRDATREWQHASVHATLERTRQDQVNAMRTE